MNELDKPLVEIDKAVDEFAQLDAACERIKEKGICDALGIQCNSSCTIYVQKDQQLKTLERLIKNVSTVTAGQSTQKTFADQPMTIEKSERVCPSCGQKPAREEAKYCDYCGEEL